MMSSWSVQLRQMERDYENYKDARFEEEIFEVCNAVLKEHNFPLARVWVPCSQNPECCGQPSDHVSPSQSVCLLREQGNDSTHPGIPLFKPGSHLLKGEGIVGKALMTNHPVLSTCIASSSNTGDSLSRYSGTDRLRTAAVAIPLKSNFYNEGCILECILPLDCTDPEEQKKISTTLLSTLKKCRKTLCVVSDEVLDENSGFPSPAIQAQQPLDAVKQFFSEENPREADPNYVMPDSNDQIKICLSPLPSNEQDEIWRQIDDRCSESQGTFIQQRLPDKNFQEFKDEISQILDSAFKRHGLPLALAWIPCILNPTCSSGQLSHEDSVSVLEERWDNLSYFNLDFFSTHLEKGKGIIGKPFTDSKAFFSPSIASSFNTNDRLYQKLEVFGPDTALVTIPLKSNIHNSECVFLLLLPLNCRDLEEQKKILMELFSTLNQSCSTLHVVANKVVDEQSDSLFLDFRSVAVEPNVASNSSFQNENPRESSRKHLMHLFPESSVQNEKRPDPTSRIEPAEMREAALGLGRPAASETSEARHGTGESTGGVTYTCTGSAGSKRDWAWKYCSSIMGNSNGVICSFCDLEIKGGGITRFKSHISGSDPSKNVKKCENVPPEVKAEIEHKGKKRR